MNSSFKYIGALVVFLAALAINFKTAANEPMPQGEVCTGETAGKADCADTNSKGKKAEANEGHEKKKAAKDWSEKREDQVGKIFPEKNKVAGKNEVPEKVKLTAPAFLAKINSDTVKLEWSAGKGAKVYHVQVSRDAGFNNRSMYIFEDKNVASTSVEIKGLEKGTKYFWRVASYNPEQLSQYTKSLFVSSEFEVK